MKYPDFPVPDPEHIPTLSRRGQGVPVVPRVFESGAIRDTDEDKLDYEGFLSPLVLKRYAQYMHKHRKLPNGDMRDSDNWQKGIPLNEYMSPMWRHFMEVWSDHRAGGEAGDEALCALLFNVMGYLHEILKKRVGRKEAREKISNAGRA